MANDKRKLPREYMEMAITVMKNSIHEKREDKSSPLVGAVLVFSDGTVDTAFRGELREGDHAEYTVLDKKNRSKNTSGAWLFATLEPCAPGARNAPKISCSERIVNARVAEVWFGIEDPDPKVDHSGIIYLESHGIKVHQFDKDLHNEIEKFNESFLKGAHKRKKDAVALKQSKSGTLNAKAVNTKLDDLSDEALQKFLDKSKIKAKINSTKFIDELLQMELIEYDEKTKSNIPTGNAILLFGKQPRLKFPQASVKAKVDYGNGKTDVQSFDDALVLIPEKVEAWAKKVIPESFDRSKFARSKTSSFPIEVIDEVINNAIIHRDYSIDGAKVQLEITPDKIVVKSPGKPVPPIKLEALQNFTATSISRNKTLAYVFNLMEYMEEVGVGMDTYRDMRVKYNLPLPIITYVEPNLIVTFPRTADAIRDLSNNVAISKLNDEELAGYDWIKLQSVVTTKSYANHFNFSEKKAQRQLANLKEKGFVILTGRGVGAFYKYIAYNNQ